MKPHPKVAVPAVVAAVYTLAIAGLTAAGVTVSPDLATAVLTVITFGAGYLTPQGVK